MPAPTGRGNGLAASTWTPVADLDPQIADAMLAALRDEGVAAYAAPSSGTRGAYLEVRLPDRPTDRLFVDASATDAATRVLHEQLPGLRAALDEHAAAVPSPAQPVDDDAWSSIVASFELASADPVPRWPVSEDVDDDGDETGRRSGRLLRPALRGPGTFDELRDVGAPDAPYDARAAEDPADHYVPPDPPPLPEGDAISRFAWIGVIGGPVFLIVAALLRWELAGWTGALPLVAFMAGFVTLVARMRDRPDDSDPDDGAVV
jgi:hypothetical protein